MSVGERRTENVWQNADRAREKLCELFDALIEHPGFGQLDVSMKLLKHGKKEVIISSGRQFRFVLQPANPAQEGDS